MSVADRSLRVALAGNPNCGKTTIFNALTGARQKVGNYPGVTVERRVGVVKRAGLPQFDVVDLPGVYSLARRSPDESIAVDAVLGRLSGESAPDLIVNICDASNLARNLFLTTQLLELERPVLVVLNMIDRAGARLQLPDAGRLAERLRVPVHVLKDHGAESMDGLARAIRAAADRLPPSPVLTLPAEFEAAIAAARPLARAETLIDLVADDPRGGDSDLSAARSRLRAALDRPWKVEAEARYRAIDALLADVVPSAAATRPDRTARLDAVLLHPIGGPLIFFLVMGLVFQALFTWASVPSDLLEAGFGAFTAHVSDLVGPGMFHDLLIDGVLAGVLNVLVFLPQIVLLFLGIGLLEDFGYLARAVFLIDRPMRRLGLHGRSFVPMMSSFACAIPGILGARTIDSPAARLVTILVAPLMSCSARLPVYTLVIAAFFSDATVWGVVSQGGLVLLALYLLGIFAAATMAFVFRRTIVRGATPTLIMELPPYRAPRLGTVLRHTASQAWLFVRKVWTVILSLTVVLWFLQNFPRDEVELGATETERQVLEDRRHAATDGAERASIDRDIAELERHTRARILEQSHAGRIGKFIEPTIRPLGFDWRLGIGLLASFAAREVLVSTLAQVFAVDASDESVANLASRLREARDPQTKERLYRPLTGLSLAVFFVLACQCLSTVAVVRQETAGWRWPLFMVAYMTVLAWSASFVTFTVGAWVGY